MRQMSIQGSSGIQPLHSYYFGPVRNEEVIEAEVKFGYLGRIILLFYLLTIAIDSFVLCSLILDFKCGQTKATAILKVIAPGQ